MPNFPRFVLLFSISIVLFDSTFEQFDTVSLSSQHEHLSLFQLRSSLGLRSKQWPIKAEPCTNWVGVQCRNGSVVGINISGFRRTRIGRQNPQFSVDSIANFSFLESFNASRFLLPGSIPDWFGQRLIALQVLDLRDCSIVGTIPTSLGNLSSLSVLYLSGNGLTGSVPDSLSQLSKLSVLDLSHNSLVGSIPQSFGSVANLTLLDMSVNNLSGFLPPDIGSLTKLEILNLSSNSLSSLIPPQLGDLSNLIEIDLSFNSFFGSLSPDLSVLRNLRKMVIGNNQLSGPLPSDLFAKLTKLELIVLSHNKFDGEFPDILWTMPSIRFLDASGNKLTGVLPNYTSAAIGSPAVYNLSQNMFYGVLTDVIQRFSFIDLSNNYFQGRVPEYARNNATFNRNCFRGESSQRSVATCASFYADRRLTFDNFGLHVNQPPLPKSQGKSHSNTVILAGVLGGLGFIALVIILLALLILCLYKRRIIGQRTTGIEPVAKDANLLMSGGSLKLSNLPEGFTYEQILQATSEFSDEKLIRKGNTGDFFLGVVERGLRVVIKRVDLSIVKKDAYLRELDVFSKLSHPRFVPLLGHCLEDESEKFLIYKYMPNGDLSSSLYREKSSDDDGLQSLDWITRLKIATGVAEALCYLHHECSPPLVHRDIQGSSILLDDKFEVRLGSLSEVCAQEEDIHQSMMTRLLRMQQTSEQASSDTHPATCANDVYCFGKVLLELVTGKVGPSTSLDGTTKEWFEETLPYISIYDKELVTNMMDPTLIVDDDLIEEVWAMAVVAKSCLNPRPARRPLMRYVLKALENPLKVVREESISSRRLKTTSSRGSWGAGLFGSWRSSSDVASVAGLTNRAEGVHSFKRSGTAGSQGSNLYAGGDLLSSD